MLLRDKDLFKSNDPQVKIRIEQYFLITYYSLWEVILNEQRLAKKNELKARGTLLVALLDKHQLKFNIHKDVKSLMEAIKKRFGGNKETKKVHKTLLKQQYKNFSGTSSESLNQIHDRLQKLINQLKILDESISQEDINLKFLRRGFSKKTRRNLGANGTTAIGFDMSKVECYNCHRKGHFAMECRSPRDNRNKEALKRTVPVEADEEPTNFALMAYASSGSSSSSTSDNETSSKNLSKLLESQISDKTRLGYDSQVFDRQVFDYDELHSSESDDSVPICPVHDSKSIDQVVNVESSSPKPSQDMSKPLRSDAPIIKDWTSDSEDEYEIEFVPTQKEPSFVLTTKHVKPPRASVKPGNPQQALKDKGVIDSGCSRHMTRNISYLHTLKHSMVDMLHLEEIQKVVRFQAKNSVLFTETECVVLSSNFKLHDENHVLLRVPRENNMYNVDLKNVVPSGDPTCRVAKDILDESNLWHRRLGNINFKTMNKLVKGNLVRGLSSNFLKNNHTCVACKKGKQRRASCKSKLFCEMKKIKREFSVARTPQQNRVAERKNKTLIEAARTMLADSLLLIPFWADAVNTACYVQNRVLVTKPHNKTPYELLLGRSPSIGFMRPFGCLDTILNILDPLGKFDGKADEGFLVGYSVNNKAFRVFNSITRIVQETLHINFLENQPNIAGSGPKWLFDIFTLFQSMNYQPVVARNQPNHNAGIKETLDVDVDAAFDVKGNENEVHVSPNSSDKPKKHDEKAKRQAKGKSLVDLSTRVRDLSDEFEEFFVNSTNRVNAASAPVTAVGPNPTNSTNNFIAASPSDNVVSPNFEIDGKSSFVDPSQYLDDPDMPALEDIVYMDDIIFGSTNKKLCKAFEKLIKDKFQMSSMGELTFFFGLQKPLLKDPDGEDVDVHIYRYLKGKPDLGLWYPKDSLFNLVAYSNSDYAGASLDRKFTTRGCQFFDCRLISWQCKKQSVVATSSTETEYVAAASCCAKVLWIQN
nr:ribonuclease H-like domain-containing protein [Tanacetum cinerariifolium]